MIPYGQQEITESDIEAVVQVLKSKWLTQGPAVPLFEQVVSEYCGAAYAVATNSATSALHIACLALGLGPGDRLWTTPITFVASANCGLYCGAHVDFVDIDAHTLNLSVEALREKLVRAEREKCLPKIVVPVHFAGQSCDMREIRALADRYGFHIIEDASHALGGRYENRPIGDCRYSDVVVFSFHPVKIVTTGEGGMALTNNRRIAETMARLRSHGISRNPREMVQNEGPWYYEQHELGFNYRITDIQAALGVSQMRRLDSFVARRRALAERYDRLLADLPLTRQTQAPHTQSAYHLYVVRLKLSEVPRSRREVFEYLRTAGIGVNVHYIPVHLQPYYRSLGFHRGMFPQAEAYYTQALTLPLYPGLTETQQDTVVSALRASLV